MGNKYFLLPVGEAKREILDRAVLHSSINWSEENVFKSAEFVGFLAVRLFNKESILANKYLVP
jgi:hypothetical protein